MATYMYQQVYTSQHAYASMYADRDKVSYSYMYIIIRYSASYLATYIRRSTYVTIAVGRE